MSAPTIERAPIEQDQLADADPLCHYVHVQCDPALSFCGRSVAFGDWEDVGHVSCVVCIDIERTGVCPHCKQAWR